MKIAALLAVLALAAPTVPPDDDGDTVPDGPEPVTPAPPTPTPTPTPTPEAIPTVVLEPTSTPTAVPTETPTPIPTPTVEATPVVSPEPPAPEPVPSAAPEPVGGAPTPIPEVPIVSATPGPGPVGSEPHRRHRRRHADRPKARVVLRTPARIAAPRAQGQGGTDAGGSRNDRRVGARTGRVYVVVTGDTLSGIGERYGRDWRELAEINGLENPDLIFPGQRILL